MRLPHIDNTWTVGNVVTMVAAVLALITTVGGTIAQANTVPSLALRVGVVESAVARLTAERDDDQRAAIVMKQDIIDRLNRIESKLDTKADKDAEAKGWVRR